MTLAIQSFNKSDLKNKILILGDMYELGKEEDKFHQEIVDYCESLVIDRVFLIGDIFSKSSFTKKFISCKNYKELLDNKDFKNIINSNIIICFFKYYEFITFILSKKTIGINLSPLIYLLKKIDGLNTNLTNHPR